MGDKYAWRVHHFSAVQFSRKPWSKNGMASLIAPRLTKRGKPLIRLRLVPLLGLGVVVGQIVCSFADSFSQ